jgi:hypothetical protein
MAGLQAAALQVFAGSTAGDCGAFLPRVADVLALHTEELSASPTRWRRLACADLRGGDLIVVRRFSRLEQQARWAQLPRGEEEEEEAEGPPAAGYAVMVGEFANPDEHSSSPYVKRLGALDVRRSSSNRKPCRGPSRAACAR